MVIFQQKHFHFWGCVPSTPTEDLPLDPTEVFLFLPDPAILKAHIRLCTCRAADGRILMYIASFLLALCSVRCELHASSAVAVAANIVCRPQQSSFSRQSVAIVINSLVGAVSCRVSS